MKKFLQNLLTLSVSEERATLSETSRVFMPPALSPAVKARDWIIIFWRVLIGQL